MDEKENTKGLTNEEENEEENEVDEGQVTNGAASNSKDDSSQGKAGKAKERSFTQEQVTRMMTREKSQGRAAAYKELGIDPKDKKTVDMFKAFLNSQKTEEQKAAERAIEVQKKQEEAEHRALVAEAKAEAMMLGVKPQYVEDAIALAFSRWTDGTDLKTILGELKEKYDIWFKDGEDDSKKNDKNGSNKTGQKGTGASVKETSKKVNDEKKGSLGARLASQRRQTTSKKSFWGSK